MAIQVAKRTEGLAATWDLARVLGSTEMELHVLLQLGVVRESALASGHRTSQRQNGTVQALVARQIPGCRKALAAGLDRTHMRFLARVGLHVL